jgi:RNA polymerase sigma factor (sigma-70 family)
MTPLPLGRVLYHLRRVADPREAAGVSDADLLERFLGRRDEAAFELLVRRHERLVWGVCARVLRRPQDADDAFQATFLAFLRRARSIRRRASVAGWLHRVAHRVAIRAGEGLARRGRRETTGTDLSAVPAADDAGADRRDLAAVIDEEVNRLAERYRLPVVLCYLGGKTYAEAARELGCPKGTISIRLTRARELLRARLAGRGLAALTPLLAAAAPAPAAPAPLVAATVKLALAGATSARVAALAQGAGASVGGKAAVALAFALGLFLTGTVLLARPAPAPEPERPAEEAPKQAGRDADRPKPPEREEAAKDRYGDPLPAGALLRLGTVRLRHAGLNGLAFSADGKVLLSVGGDEVIRAWDVATGAPARTCPGPDKLSSFEHSVLSPNGKLVAVPNWNSIRVWDVAAGKQRASTPVKRGNGLPLAFSPDGKLLATADDQGVVQLLDVDGLKEGRRWPHDRPVSSVAFSPDGKVVGAISSPRGSLRLWEVESGKEVAHITTGERYPSFAFSPDGKLLATVGWGQSLALWDARTGESRATLALPERKRDLAHAPGVAFSPDGKILASSGHGLPVLLWDVATRKELRRLDAGTAPLLAFSPDGKTLATAGNNSVRLWDVATGRESHARDAHHGEVNAVAVSPDGKLIATGSWQDYTVRLWDRATGRQLHCLVGHTAYVRAVTFTPDGRTLISGAGDSTIRLWDAGSGKEVRVLPLVGPKKGVIEQVISLRLSTDGKALAAVCMPTNSEGAGPTYRIWDLARGGDPVVKPADSMQRFLIGPDARTLGGYRDRAIVLTDMTTGKGKEWPDETGAGEPLAFSAGGKLLAVGSAFVRNGKGVVELWDIAEGKILLSLAAGEPGFAAFSHDARYVATAGPEDIRLWEVATAREVLRRSRPAAFHGQHGNSFASSLAFTPDGRALVTGLPDTTVLVWDLAPGQGPKREEIARLWDDLADDGPKGYAAVWSLAPGSGKAVVTYLKERLAPVSVDGPRVRRLIAELDSEDFEVRERAKKALGGFADEARPLFREALAGKPSAEVRKALEELLSRDLYVLRSGELLRGVRAVEVLERLGTPEARQVLEALAKGAAEARLTREARAAVKRLSVSD